MHQELYPVYLSQAYIPWTCYAFHFNFLDRVYFLSALMKTHSRPREVHLEQEYLEAAFVLRLSTGLTWLPAVLSLQVLVCLVRSSLLMNSAWKIWCEKCRYGLSGDKRWKT